MAIIEGEQHRIISMCHSDPCVILSEGKNLSGEKQILPFEAQGRHFVQDDSGGIRMTAEESVEKAVIIRNQGGQ